MDGMLAIPGHDTVSSVGVSSGSAPSGATSSGSPAPARAAVRTARQHTLGNSISSIGVGLHTGRRIRLTLHPAAENTGIVFRRTDLDDRTIPARFDHVVDTRLSTVIGDATDPALRIATIEHLMSALSGSGVDNVLIDVDGPEIPVFDGSAADFIFLLDCAGLAEQAAPRTAIDVLRPVRVTEGDAFAELRPGREGGLSLTLSIDFPAAAIGEQTFATRLDRQGYRAEIANCRTFTLRQEIEALHRAGLARGGSLDNAIVVDGASVLNPSGLRRPDEFVRHKMIDAVGDLYLAGGAINGLFTGHKSGHALNNRLLRALFADRAAWRMHTRAQRAQAALRAAA
ncbi:UDP-3-0-acyl N-acetylglucosamine deacetylase [Gluconacetobacter diazotrophicus PA1 5]|uniref:UDP-3-O-acyl-N-acetylglucosamine deacetylase n=2 Tax=Gluconacetobacter diazotrophicus TaxID=33996 RepID=A9H0K8_GLUDA|nr:UDP-3-O-acyl-N-acetylglucosamine deacetylase [Gluconacetobacter diazotrophicus]ACI52893.1 UDP-3-0-acyl N-acetylglucosamine deacetylase [Gluconacetobacter diazotrophicus PA1 5]MBB2155368.1 UDP-3-O-acyl-N-acetylglucosamine deacetylase [Gluconacetobacter diazotrophicus]TWB08962.1 UDP-3-O-[3-hydroxymyristoyl] N-acetylglucosamine deacetylase [Gluconacetobacter diazotrophicus]CAP57140.1 putative UDP-3-O-[3-hydroxymyristoyl] N-acetylglucosamine deacetylase [Gluconacetobacter diazotrophicus PA1 5]